MSSDQSDLTTFDGACVRFEMCGNVVPANGQICADCLDAVRADNREKQNEREKGT